MSILDRVKSLSRVERLEAQIADLSMLLLAAVDNYGRDGILPLSTYRDVAQKLLDADGYFTISATSPNGELVLLEGRIGKDEAGN